MRILGLSSATKIISAALLDNEKLLFETTLAGLSSEKILFYVKEAGIAAEQIEAVAVTVGPGSYSGLRGGLATAKTLAQTLGIPLAAVSTLEAMAYNLVNMEGVVAVILDAKSDDYNFALFGMANGKLQRLTDDLVVKLDHLQKTLSNICGPIYLLGKVAGFKKVLSGENFHFVENVQAYPYGTNVARLGQLKIQAGEITDPLRLVPTYSHLPNIHEFHQR